MFFDLFLNLGLFIVQAFFQLFLEGFLILFLFKCPRFLSVLAKQGFFYFHWCCSQKSVHSFLIVLLKIILYFIVENDLKIRILFEIGVLPPNHQTFDPNPSIANGSVFGGQVTGTYGVKGIKK